MTNFTTLSVYDNRQLSTSGKGKAKRYFCDKIEIGKETFLLIRQLAHLSNECFGRTTAVYFSHPPVSGLRR